MIYFFLGVFPISGNKQKKKLTKILCSCNPIFLRNFLLTFRQAGLADQGSYWYLDTRMNELKRMKNQVTFLLRLCDRVDGVDRNPQPISNFLWKKGVKLVKFSKNSFFRLFLVFVF